jgi:predicted lipid-binding transport protein (Tim44 family)
MNRNWSAPELKCLATVVAVALLAAPTVQAAAANDTPVTRDGSAAELRSMTAGRQAEPNQARPYRSGKSYLWSDTAMLGGVLAGIVVLGLWGDVAIGGAILGIQLLCVGAAIAARKAGAHARKASRRVWQVAGSNATASSR